MSVLISNLNMIESIKLDIASAIEAKGVSMSGVSFPDYPSAIASISGGGGGYTEVDITERNYNIVNLNNSASYIGSYAFYAVSTLVTVNLPNVTEISYSGIFQFCRSITDVNLSNCSAITGGYVFNGCRLLSNIYIPICSVIGTNCFADCGALSSISLPLCEKIDTYAFRYCSLLSQINLPKCSSIGQGAFANCSILSVIMIGKDVSTVASLNNTVAFQNTPIASGTGTIYVPASLVSDYQAANNWSAFASQIVSIPE